jgi:hypothetical protein
MTERIKGYISNSLTFGYSKPVGSDGPSIRWEVYADNADKIEGMISFNDGLREK